MTPDFLAEFEFFAGVPDSQLKALCSWLYDRYGISDRHVIAANEGNAAALAAGYHLATGKTPVVYLQNSGLGNIVNPAASLLHEKVYGIPCLFIVGWRLCHRQNHHGGANQGQAGRIPRPVRPGEAGGVRGAQGGAGVQRQSRLWQPPPHVPGGGHRARVGGVRG